MNRSLHGLRSASQRLQYIQCRQSTAFDPWHYLHHDTVKKEQSESFRKVWKNNIGDFKQGLTAEEVQMFEERVQQTEGFDEFYAKMKELFSPRRHHAIRTTRTWQYARRQVAEFAQRDESALTLLMFGDDTEFEDEFAAKYLRPGDSEGLLSDFVFADLRYLCAVQALDAYVGEEGPRLSAVFGCRERYHFNVPDACAHSAHYLDCMYSDRVSKHDLVLLSVLCAVKEGAPVNQLWFRNKLEAMEDNALKDPSWRTYAEEFMTTDTDSFYDKLDRAFVAFQTDEGVSELNPRFDTDID